MLRTLVFSPPGFPLNRRGERRSLGIRRDPNCRTGASRIPGTAQGSTGNLGHEAAGLTRAVSRSRRRVDQNREQGRRAVGEALW